MKAWQKKALSEANDQVVDIQDSGHTVTRYTDYHWKIDDFDVWPSSKKYMRKGVVKNYQKLTDIFLCSLK